MCFILCSKFGKNRLSAGPAGGVYSSPQDSLAGSWGRRKAEKEGQEGREREAKKGKGRRREGKEAEEGSRNFRSTKSPDYGPSCPLTNFPSRNPLRGQFFFTMVLNALWQHPVMRHRRGSPCLAPFVWVMLPFMT